MDKYQQNKTMIETEADNKNYIHTHVILNLHHYVHRLNSKSSESVVS
jgi:hypothetical protein